ncbi:hypothetical protein DFJ74DRAFT_651782 [Hyaloraphidium curvatum]|nr:hypothetical protein DFJ74DRAFT_651782 [Hyaloraphidium curvatum]
MWKLFTNRRFSSSFAERRPAPVPTATLLLPPLSLGLLLVARAGSMAKQGLWGLGLPASPTLEFRRIPAKASSNRFSDVQSWLSWVALGCAMAWVVGGGARGATRSLGACGCTCRLPRQLVTGDSLLLLWNHVFGEAGIVARRNSVREDAPEMRGDPGPDIAVSPMHHKGWSSIRAGWRMQMREVHSSCGHGAHKAGRPFFWSPFAAAGPYTRRPTPLLAGPPATLLPPQCFRGFIAF